MLKLPLITLFCILFAGCSVVEKKGYYTPEVDPKLTSGPKKPYCGFANFGGMPDQWVSKVGQHEIAVEAYQYHHPYLWGPWFVTVVPVFPITWAVEPFVNDDLTVEVSISQDAYLQEGLDSYYITYDMDDGKLTKPSSVDIQPYMTYIRFPVDSDSVDKFIFHIVGFGDPIKIPFSKTSRWSWTQVTPNC